MPRKEQPPSYRLHKAPNCPVVTIDGKNHYLGAYGSDETHEKYARLIAQWREMRHRPTGSRATDQQVSNLRINEVTLRYWQFTVAYYRKNGAPTRELSCIREALRPLRRLYGNCEANAFGPLALKCADTSPDAVQQTAVRQARVRVHKGPTSPTQSRHLKGRGAILDLVRSQRIPLHDPIAT